MNPAACVRLRRLRAAVVRACDWTIEVTATGAAITRRNPHGAARPARFGAPVSGCMRLFDASGRMAKRNMYSFRIPDGGLTLLGYGAVAGEQGVNRGDAEITL